MGRGWWNIVRNGSLWSAIFFEKEVIFHEFDIETSDLELEVSKSSVRKHTTLCDKDVFFLSLLSRNFDDWLSSNFHRFVILCICWDTPSEKTGLWQLPIVSCKELVKFNHVVAIKLTKKAALNCSTDLILFSSFNLYINYVSLKLDSPGTPPQRNIETCVITNKWCSVIIQVFYPYQSCILWKSRTLSNGQSHMYK